MTRGTLSGKRLLFVGMGLAVATAGMYTTVRVWPVAAIVEFPIDWFPPGLSAALQSDLSKARQRVIDNPGPGSWGALGELCMAHELMPQADFCFRQASSLAADNPRWWYLQGIIAEEVDSRQAISCYEKTVQLDPAVAAAHLRLGRLLARIGEFDAAQKSFDIASELSQQNPIVLQAMAQLSMMQGDSEHARKLMDQAAADQRAGQDVIQQAQRLPGKLSAEGSSLKSKPASERPLSTSPLEEPWLAGVAWCSPQTAKISGQAASLATMGQFGEARRLYEHLLTLEDRGSRPHMYHAMVLMNAGEVDKALEEINSVCRRFPNDAMALSCRGAIQARLGDISGAILSLQESVRLKPDFIDAHRALLTLYQSFDPDQHADDIDLEFRTLLTLSPSDQQMLKQYAAFQEIQHSR